MVHLLVRGRRECMGMLHPVVQVGLLLPVVLVLAW